MTKTKALFEISKAGDATITLKDNTAFVATIDFSTPYIKEKKAGFYKMFSKTRLNNNIILFNWTTNSFLSLDCNLISTIEGLQCNPNL